MEKIKDIFVFQNPKHNPMKVINLGEKNSILNSFVAQMRDKDIQKDSMRFRKNLERLGNIFAYEISQTLNHSIKDVVTPLGIAKVPTYDDKIVVSTILRAGLPLHEGILNYFDNAQSAFVAAYRKNSKDGSFKVRVEYVSSCDLEGKILLLVDPMLATGQSLCLTYEALLEKCGKPLHTHIASVVASEQGVDYAMKHLPSKSTTLWVGAVDAELTSRAYIVPGIGDAGDLAFGEKL